VNVVYCVTVLFIGIFWGEIPAIVSSIILCLFMLATGFAITNGYLTMNDIEPMYNHLFASWLTSGLALIFFSGAAFLIPCRLIRILAQRNQELNDTKEELETKNLLLKDQSNKRKQLLHVLCHDLANPLSSINILLDMVEEQEEFDESLLKFLKVSAVNSSEIITQIRELVVADHAVDKKQCVKVPLTSLIEESQLILSHRFKEKKVQLSVDIDPNISICVIPTIFISSILNNLFTNAIKFSYINSQIACRAIKVQNTIKLSIKDTGIGMPADILDSIFDMSKPTSRPGTEGEKGTGFGMPLIKRYVEAFGGEINVFSFEESSTTCDSGTTVVITLPAAPDEAIVHLGEGI